MLEILLIIVLVVGISIGGTAAMIGWIYSIVAVEAVLEDLAEDKTWPVWFKRLLPSAGMFLGGGWPFILLIFLGDPGWHGLITLGRFVLLLGSLCAIVVGWPLVWWTEWPKWLKVVACVALAVGGIAGRIALGWYDQDFTPSVPSPPHVPAP